MRGKTVCLFIAMALLTVYAYGQQFEPEGNFRWERTGTGVTITHYVGTNRDIRIPPQIQGMPVIGIGLGAFARNHLTSVNIPDSVTYIGDNAFVDNQLTNVTIPASVTTIGNTVFSGNRLTNVSILGNDILIGNFAFIGSRLTSIVIGNNVTITGVAPEAEQGIGNFHASFAQFYQNQGRRAGVYTFSNGRWGVQFR